MKKEKNRYIPIPGKHCESSAIVNALIFQSYFITEEQVIGAGAAPGFVYEKTGFPFLGGRSHTMKGCFFRTCMIPHTFKEKSTVSDWNDIEHCINQNIPVILRVDMRFLPYLFNGKFGPRHMSFGWHYVTLFGLDNEKKIAQVSDTSFSELKDISYNALKKARFSKTKVYPPNGEYYYFYKSDTNFSINWNEIAMLSLKQYFFNMNEKSEQKNQLKGLSGLHKLTEDILGLPKTVMPFLVGAILDFHYGCIEINGTGGSAFRTMYYRFLEKHLSCDNRNIILASAKQCELSWHNLAETYKYGASIYNKETKVRKKELLLNISERIKNVYEAENEMNCLIKELFNLSN